MYFWCVCLFTHTVLCIIYTFRKRFIYSFQGKIYRKKETQKGKDLLSAGSLLKWPNVWFTPHCSGQRWGNEKPRAMSLFSISHLITDSLGLGPYSAAFPSYNQWIRHVLNQVLPALEDGGLPVEPWSWPQYNVHLKYSLDSAAMAQGLNPGLACVGIPLRQRFLSWCSTFQNAPSLRGWPRAISHVGYLEKAPGS